MNTSLIINPKALQCELFKFFFRWITFRINEREYILESRVETNHFLVAVFERAVSESFDDYGIKGDPIFTVRFSRALPSLNSVDFSDYDQLFTELLQHVHQIARPNKIGTSDSRFTVEYV